MFQPRFITDAPQNNIKKTVWDIVNPIDEKQREVTQVYQEKWYFSLGISLN